MTKEHMLAMGRLYMSWCHAQPIMLFNPESFLASLEFRDRELLLAIQSFGYRYPPGILSPQQRDQIALTEREAKNLVMDRIADSEIQLSTLQTLCLLSLSEFADGKVAQAGLTLSMATHLARAVQPDNTLGDVQEFSDCARSIVMLQNLQGGVSSSPHIADNIDAVERGFGAAFAGGARSMTAEEQTGVPESSCQMDSGIMRYAAELSQIWRMTRAYAACRVGSKAPPPWNQQSDYSCVMQMHLEFDCRVPVKYRFAANKFGDQDQKSIEQQRHYWGPWLFIQIVYSVIPCILNHPFLLSMRLKSFRHTIPQSFIHQSFEHLNRHAGWIMYFIDLLEKKAFYFADLSIAHCIAVVATIHLQHSFVQDQELRDRAQQGYEQCLDFLQRLGGTWPSVSTMANNLEKLRASIVVVESSHMDERASGQPSFAIDAQLLWDILIYERAGREHASVDQSIFGNTLSIGVAPREQDDSRGNAAEFDLVGSAGISGHKAVSKETPVYAPHEETLRPSMMHRYDRLGGNGPDDVPTFGGSSTAVQDRFFEGMGGDQEHLFLQAHDFGKAIDSWLEKY
ncbi:hypothetical protein VHEMI09124 [[Torrubiella] hemipterigena]|nr:hypothetical protein VHEMI09124 [[Torrubiella] hemipterigena]